MKKIFNFLFLVLLFASCNKESNIDNGQANVNVAIAGVEYDGLNVNKFGAISDVDIADLKTYDIAWDENTDLEINVKTSLKSNTGKLASSSIENEREKLTSGNTFRVLIFDKDHRFLAKNDYRAGVNSSEGIQLSTGVKYSFVTYSFGQSAALPELDIKVGDKLEDAVLKLEKNVDAMLTSKLDIQLNKGSNDLNLILKHKFCKIKTIIDATDVGRIENIGDFVVNNVFTQADIKFDKSVSDASRLIFNNFVNSEILESFELATSKTSAESPGQIIYADGETMQSLVLKNLKINGVEKTDIKIGEVKFKPGVYYEFELKLKPSVNTGFIIGNLIWSNGNLELKNGVYSFATSQGEYGDHWYRKLSGEYFVTPFILNKNQDKGVGNTSKDLCKEVNSIWRTPTPADIKNLESYANWWGNPTNKFVGNYTKTDGTISKGVYYGTNSQPSKANQDNYLFLPFAGAYNTLNSQEMGQSGFYWHTGLDKNNEGTSLQFSSYFISPNNNGGLDNNRANTIRCVKDF